MENKDIHKLLALIPAFENTLQRAAKLQREIMAIKLPLKRGRPIKNK